MQQYWKITSLFPLVWHNFDNDFVVYFQDTGNTHQLNEKAAYILKLLEDGLQTECDIIAQIESEKKFNLNNSEHENIEQYVRHTLNQFVISHLIS